MNKNTRIGAQKEQLYVKRIPKNLFESIIFKIASDLFLHRILILPYLPTYFISAPLLKFSSLFKFISISIFIVMLIFSIDKSIKLEEKIIYVSSDKASITSMFFKHVLLAVVISLFLIYFNKIVIQYTY